MGKLINGIFGGFHGRIGNLVGYTLKGKYIIRKIGRSSKPLTPGRKANCQKMTLVNEILSPSLPAIQVGYRLMVAGTDKNEYNEAVSYNKRNALQGAYPNLSLDYSKVLLSMGTLPAAIHPTISQTDDKITFNWEPTADQAYQYGNDRAMLVVYFPDLKVSRCDLIGSKRIEGAHTLNIDQEHVHERMEAYISFVKDNGREVSDSAYAGALNARKTLEILEKADPEAERSNRDSDYAGSDFDIISYREYLLASGIGVPEPKSGPDKIITSRWSIYVLKSRVSDQRIGDCYLRLQQNDKFTAEMKVSIAHEEQRKGYAKEASSVMISLLFNKSEVNRIVKIVDAQDSAAIALMKSLGFREEEHFKESAFSDGKWISEYQFALLKSDWV
ncbi:Acetyltransferase (GNAT) domain-containing protein [Pedobacter steynii]|uniref:Acetyltransferase (GNAT) domain-containing protein n=1 Tax=Pedobacter steynii TaxID=430522 RepID=A0A1G9KFF9_9SPHI|nr:GNAT family N-acetyltransferase [Pedobacter steynii]NQX38534.1 GNAT family N-acetyltransferase [Pedobacter steynii]SDL48369.1 Acetyltransferase (GNAT) domain-containing protein [Pedobacter steynii]